MIMGLKPHVHAYILNLTLLFAALVISDQVCAGTFSVVPASNCLTCDGSVTFNSDLPGTVDYQWTLPDGTVVFNETNALGVSSMTNLCTGVWLVSAIAADGTEEYQVVNVPVAGENPGVSSDMLTCSDATPGNLFFELGGTPEAGGTWLDPSGGISDGMFDPEINDAGLYLYTVSSGGCDVTSGVLVTVSQNADPGLSTTYLICETYDPFFLTDLLAGSPDYGGEWSGPGNVPIDGWFSPETMGTGLFSYMIDTVEGCGPVFSTMYVIENFLPDPGLPSSIEICPNAVPFDLTLELDGTPELGGEWTDDDNDPINTIFDPAIMPAGIYYYEVDGDTPCPDQETTITVGYTDGITAGDGGAVDLCSLDAPLDMWTEVEGSPDAGGTWTNNLGVEIGGFFDASSQPAGTYTYTVDAVGCQPVSSDLIITVEQAMLAGDDVVVDICVDAGAVSLNDFLSSADPGGVWLDEFGMETDPLLTAVVGSTSYVYFQEGDICPDDNAIITVTFDPIPDAGPNQSMELCEDQAILDLTTIVPDPGSFAVVWTDPMMNIVTPDYDPATGTQQIFNYQVISSNSCPDDVAQIVMDSEAILFGDGTSLLEVCNTADVLDLNDELPVANLPTNLWEDGSGNAMNGSVDPASSETDTYTYTFVNGDVCPPSVFVVDVEVYEQPDAGNDGQAVFCFNEDPVDLESLLAGEDAGGFWTLDGLAIPSVFDPAVGGEGSYVYNLDANGPCPATQSFVDIIIDQGVEYDGGDDVVACAGDAPVQIGQDPEATCTYSWNPPTNLDDESVANPTVDMINNSDQIQEIDYVVTISNGICTTTDTVKVTVYPLPSLVVIPDFAACVGDDFILGVEGAFSYEWMPAGFFDDNTVQNPTASIEQTTLFTVTGASAFGCVSEESVLVEALELPHVNFDADPIEGCMPLQVQLINLSEVEDGATYTWVFGDGTIEEGENPVFVFSEAGSHDVSLIVQGVNGCVNELVATDYITVHPIPLASFHHSPEDLSVLNSEILTQNTSVGAIEYEWEFEQTDTYFEEEPVVSLPDMPGIYELCLTAINEHACRDTVCRSIFIAGEFLAYAPNAFTPDNDGLNDTFAPVIQGFDPSTYEFRIFNRWGELVFESYDHERVWQGEHQNGGHYVQNDVYVWTLSVQDLYTAEIHKLQGHITILR
jgi:gliding motility-associated-like protein